MEKCSQTSEAKSSTQIILYSHTNQSINHEHGFSCQCGTIFFLNEFIEHLDNNTELKCLQGIGVYLENKVNMWDISSWIAIFVYYLELLQMQIFKPKQSGGYFAEFYVRKKSMGNAISRLWTFIIQKRIVIAFILTIPSRI